MQHKVSELSGALLDAAVAKAEGHGFRLAPDGASDSLTCWLTSEASYVRELYPPSGAFDPSTEWAHGGPIIERERISVFTNGSPPEWSALMPARFEGDMDSATGEGPTPLIAAMRAYVASKFGDTVELP